MPRSWSRTTRMISTRSGTEMFKRFLWVPSPLPDWFTVLADAIEARQFAVERVVLDGISELQLASWLPDTMVWQLSSVHVAQQHIWGIGRPRRDCQL